MVSDQLYTIIPAGGGEPLPPFTEARAVIGSASVIVHAFCFLSVLMRSKSKEAPQKQETPKLVPEIELASYGLLSIVFSDFSFGIGRVFVVMCVNNFDFEIP